MQDLKPIPGWDGYKISEKGKVWSFKRLNPLLKISRPDKDGYIMVGLSKPKQTTKNVSIHRLLMLAFRYKEGCEKLHVDHINGIRNDNRLENLRWCTIRENNLYTILGGRSRNYRALSKDQVEWIKYNCIPGCRTYGFNQLARKLGVGVNTVLRSFYGSKRSALTTTNQGEKE